MLTSFFSVLFISYIKRIMKIKITNRGFSMDGFVGFTDVQVADSILFSATFCGFCIGIFISDGLYYGIKFLLKKLRKS